MVDMYDRKKSYDKFCLIVLDAVKAAKNLKCLFTNLNS